MPGIRLSRFRNKHFLALAGNGIISLFGLATLALLYRAFSLNDVGTWFFFMTTQGLLDAIRNGFLGTATIKFYAGAEARRASEVLGTVWYMAILLTGLMLAVDAGALALLPFIINAQLLVTIKWVGITIISTLPFTVIFWKLQADERYDTILWMRLVNSGSTITAFLLLYLLDRLNLESALLWNFITNCLTSIVGLLANLGGVRNIANRTKATVSEIFHFGKYSLATNMSSSLFGVADTYLITFLLGPAAMAVLGVSSKLMELVEIPLRSFVGTGISSMAVAFNKSNMHQVRYILHKYPGMLTIAFIPLAIAVLFLADIPVNILSGGKYAGTEAANIFRIAMFIALLYPIDRFNGVALDILHQPRLNFLKVLVMLSTKILTMVVFISWSHSIYAVPLSGLLTTFSGIVFGYYCLRRFIDFSFKEAISSGFHELKLLALKVIKQ